MTNPIKVLPFFLSLCNAQILTHGTAIAVIREEGQIIAATDSRVTDENVRIKPDICKIRESGGWHFTLNGTVSWSGTDTLVVVRDILATAGRLAEHAKAIEDRLKPLLDAAIRSNPSVRQSVLKMGAALSVAVFGYEDHTLKLAFIRFGILADQTTSKEVHFCPDECGGNRTAFIVPSADASSLDLNAPSLVESARNFIQMEINKNPVEICPPVQLLRVTPDGSTWIQKPDVCKDQP